MCRAARHISGARLSPGSGDRHLPFPPLHCHPPHHHHQLAPSREGAFSDGIAAAGASFITGPAEIATGKTAVLLVCACDASGAPLTRGGDHFLASVYGPAPCQTSIADLMDGRYELRVSTPAISGEFRVAVSLKGRAIGNSPHLLTVGASVADARTTRTARRRGAVRAATAGEVASFELVARDAHGKRMGYGGEQYLRLQRVGGLAEEPDAPTARGRASAGAGAGGAGAGGGGGRGRGAGKGGRGGSGGARGRREGGTAALYPDISDGGDGARQQPTTFGRGGPARRQLPRLVCGRADGAVPAVGALPQGGPGDQRLAVDRPRRAGADVRGGELHTRARARPGAGG